MVFCPKYRRPVLVDGVDDRLKELIKESCDQLNVEIIEMEIMPDHVHLLMEIDPQYGIHKAVKRIKGYSSVGGAPLSVIKQYIEDQKNVYVISMQLTETVKLYPNKYQTELIKATMTEYISTVNHLVFDAINVFEMPSPS